MPSVLQLYDLGRFPLDADRVSKDSHILPIVEISVLVRVFRIHCVHVKVLVVLTKNGRALVDRVAATLTHTSVSSINPLVTLSSGAIDGITCHVPSSRSDTLSIG